MYIYILCKCFCCRLDVESWRIVNTYIPSRIVQLRPLECAILYIGCIKIIEKKKNKNVNNFDVIHSNGGNRFIIHSRSLWKPFVRPSLRWDIADLWLVIIMDIIHAPGKPILPRLFAYARPITFGFFSYYYYLFILRPRPVKPTLLYNDYVCIFRISKRQRTKIGSFRLPISNAGVNILNSTLAYPWDHKENCVNKTINKSKKNVNYFCVNAYRRACALTHTRTNEYCTAMSPTSWFQTIFCNILLTNITITYYVLIKFINFYAW